MTILDNTGESELVQLLNTIQELSEQLAQNRSLSITLHASAGAVKTQAAHSQTGFVLRRFNLDKPQDVYDAELERMNASLAAENQGLLHDNKQLGVLIKEYEQTLESVMGAFRTRARDVQEDELALTREYEARLLAKESENLLRALSSTTAESISLGRISATLRSLLRVLNGEDVPCPSSSSPPAETNNSPSDDIDFGQREGDDRALERECELSRLERENAVLRRLLGLDVREPEYLTRSGSGGANPVDQQRLSIPRHSEGTIQKKILGGAPGTVGPYGTYKRSAGKPG
ncbi:hypothetical protein J3R82DRAFT_9607 [Butyriboletus roseoflavus]|nr:hypothetical protein J3R82DRAFT_9607 [Butyriboletus roseoflavus]